MTAVCIDNKRPFFYSFLEPVVNAIYLAQMPTPVPIALDEGGLENLYLRVDKIYSPFRRITPMNLDDISNVRKGEGGWEVRTMKKLHIEAVK